MYLYRYLFYIINYESTYIENYESTYNLYKYF